MQWIMYALISSLANAGMIQVNHHYKVDGLVLCVFRSALASVLMLFALPFVSFDFGAPFYMVMIFLGFLSVFVDMSIFNTAARYGSRLASVYMSVRILGGFIVWLFVDQASLDGLLADPLRGAGIVGCLLLSCFAISFMRKSDVSWKAFIAVAPAGLLLMLFDVIIKGAMQNKPLFDAAVVATFLMVISTFIFSSMFLFMRDKKVIGHASPTVLKACTIVALLFCVLVTCLNMALAQTPNPAYVNAVLLLSIVWIMIFHKIRGKKDDAKPSSVIFFLISALGIILLSQ